MKLELLGQTHDLASAQVIEGPDCDTFLLERAQSNGVKSTSLVSGYGDSDVAMTRTHANSLPDLTSKLDPAALRKLAESRGLVWSDSYIGRDIAYWLSDERVNSYGDITLQSWDTAFYAKSPVLAFSHEWYGLSIGAGIEWGVVNRKESDYSGPAMAFRALFAPEELSEAGNRVFKLANAGFFNGISPGFNALKIVSIEDPKERAKLGLGRYGVILAHNQLLEASPTLIGANSGALKIQSLATRAQSAGVSSDDFDFVREFERSRCKRTGEDDAWLHNDSAYLRLGRVLFPRTALSAKLIEDPIRVQVAEAPKDTGTNDDANGEGGSPAAPGDAVTLNAAQEIMDGIQGVTGLLTDGLGQVLSALDEIGDSLASAKVEATPEEEAEAETQRKEKAIDDARTKLANGATALIAKFQSLQL